MGMSVNLSVRPYKGVTYSGWLAKYAVAFLGCRALL